MLTDIAIAIVTILILATCFASAFCHDFITVRRRRSVQQKDTQAHGIR